tara:strand:- start:93 stop:764 length:672 start_codon:yes stop_codon:yes gene_type:complete
MNYNKVKFFSSISSLIGKKKLSYVTPKKNSINPLSDLFSVNSSFNDTLSWSIDKSHVMYIASTVLARKPKRILEVGIGSGYVTTNLFYSLKYNGRGTLTCVDNWHDWHGKEPKHAKIFRKKGIKIITQSEKDFVKNCEDNSFDFLVSDGDHHNSGTWINEYLRIIENDGFMFFHDTNLKDDYPKLQLIEKRILQLQLPYFHYKISSRDDEQCENGLLFSINKK